MSKRRSSPRLVFWVATLALFVGLPEAHAQPSETAPDLVPGPREITAQVSGVGYLQGAGTMMRLRSRRGYSLRAGWRPFASRRGVAEVYALYAPQGEDMASGKPQFAALGLGGTFLMREAGKRLIRT
jgi:hypothetical protein